MNKAKELKQEIDDLICLQWASEAMRNHVWQKINEYAQQVSIRDRMTILEDLAMQMWYEEKESEEYDLAYGYDDDGYPNSVSLIIYGRTHSDYRIPDFNHQNQERN